MILLAARSVIVAAMSPIGGEWRNAVANLGKNFEVHLCDYWGDLYGQTLRVALIDFIRPEMRFAGLDALKARIAAAGRAARDILATTA